MCANQHGTNFLVYFMLFNKFITELSIYITMLVANINLKGDTTKLAEFELSSPVVSPRYLPDNCHLLVRFFLRFSIYCTSKSDVFPVNNLLFILSHMPHNCINICNQLQTSATNYIKPNFSSRPRVWQTLFISAFNRRWQIVLSCFFCLFSVGFHIL